MKFNRWIAVLLALTLPFVASLLEGQTGSGFRFRQGTQDIYVGTAIRPQTAGGATIGTSAFPWGAVFTNGAVSGGATATATNCTTSPNFAITGDANTGMGSSAADSLCFPVGGTAGLTISSSGTVTSTSNLVVGTASAGVIWQGRSILRSAADGTFSPEENDGTDGIRFQFAAIPATGTCGTSPSMTTNSTDTAGSVNVGTATPASCTVTFATTWASAPFCVASNDSGATAVKVSATTTVLTLAAAVAFGNNDIVSWVCIGHK